MGSTTEVVTYKGEHCVDAVKFIYDNEKERIKVEYTGGKPYIIYMADADKKAIVNTFNLATVLSDWRSRIPPYKWPTYKKAPGSLPYSRNPGVSIQTDIHYQLFII